METEKEIPFQIRDSLLELLNKLVFSCREGGKVVNKEIVSNRLRPDELMWYLAEVKARSFIFACITCC